MPSRFVLEEIERERVSEGGREGGKEGETVKKKEGTKADDFT